MFKKFKYYIKLAAPPFENLKYRDRTVLLVLRNSQGKFILEKANDWYPDGIARLLGGGVDKGEDVTGAAIREMEEETGIVVSQEDLVELVQVDVIGEYMSTTYKTSVFVFFLKTVIDTIKIGSDVAEVVYYSEQDYRNLLVNFSRLKDDDLFHRKDLIFSWGDYGKVYGFIHQVTLDEILKRGL